MIKKQDALEFMREQEDCSADILYSDIPYALGSKVIVRKDGKVDYEKAEDFMSKWQMPTGDFWEEFFQETMRVLKYGGHCIVFGIDRQTLLFKYYSALAGFTEKQSLYWFFICLSDDSEILTNNGWRKIDTIKDTDMVAEFNLETEAVDFNEPKKIHRYDYNGELVHIANEETEQLLTFNHKCVILEEGKLKFKYAYEIIGKEAQFATLNRQEVWKLQALGKLQAVWRKVCSRNSATKETAMQLGLSKKIPVKMQERETTSKQGWESRCGLFCVWQRVLEVAKRYSGRARKYLLLGMHSQVTENGRNKKADGIKEQGQKKNTRANKENERDCYSWRGASFLERWYNLQKTKGQLLWSKTCSLSERVFSYGSERWLCYGTSVSGSQRIQDTRKNRDSSSYKSQGLGQPSGKLNAIQEQSRSQEIRSRTQYKTSVAIPTTKQYEGRVWCVETSTGAFIARRNGKVFITGNSNFPKASDLSKNIDKNAGAERDVVGEQKMGGTARKVKGKGGHGGKTAGANFEYDETKIDITAPSTPLAKKYSGYKYSIAPLKQTNETILIFQKPYKTGSCLHDTLEMEKGDKEITCGALDIDGNRCETKPRKTGTKPTSDKATGSGYTLTGSSKNRQAEYDKSEQGRYPAQTYVNEKAGERLDEMSGVSKSSGGRANQTTSDKYGEYANNWEKKDPGYGDTSGCSKVLHKCDFEEHDLYYYNPKVSKSERNAGCEEMEEKQCVGGGGGIGDYLEDVNSASGKYGSEKAPQKNIHPCCKPISLNHKILSLFKTPNEQRLLIPFAGSGSEIIGAIKAGYKNIEGCEINEEYIEIANARIKYWSAKFKEEDRQKKLI